MTWRQLQLEPSAAGALLPPTYYLFEWQTSDPLELGFELAGHPRANEAKNLALKWRHVATMRI